jgi:site-specific DNA-methyltransferase (adenine-specific)/site-specific DNA-methyltransferase (cytosine-N4-specific)
MGRRLLLLQGDCQTKLHKIPDKSVNTWITSPPYAKQREYGGAASEDYIDWMSPIIELATTKLKDSGSLFLNIKEHCINGQRDLYVFKMVIYFVEVLGLRFVDEYIWNKTNPFPTGSKKRLKDSFERVFHFTKTNDYQFYPKQVLVKSESKWIESDKRRKNKGTNNVTNGSGMNMSRRISKDIVRPGNVITGTTSNANIAHPAVYPEYLPDFFIRLTTKPNNVIGDMFMGSGTTGVASIKLNRKFVGIEQDAAYYKLAQDRIRQAELHMENMNQPKLFA